MVISRRPSIVPIPMISRKNSKQIGISIERPDDVLLTLRRVSQSLGVQRVKELYVVSGRKGVGKWKRLCLLTAGFILVTWGIAFLIYTPLQMLLYVRRQMTPGLPPFDWWIDPPDEVLLKAYFFNITNSEQFLSGTDKRLKLQQIGPIVYREKIVHTNPVFNDNDTLTYTVKRRAEFLPEMNTINFNDTVFVPNVGALLIAAHFHDASMFVKMGVNMLIRSFNTQPIIKTTVYNYLWNTTESILVPAQKLAPSLIPLTNLGLLNIVYYNYENTVTVYIGNQHGNSKYFTINTFDGSEYLPNLGDPNKCQIKFRNSTEGLSYPQMIKKDANLTYWRKTLCKLADLRYSEEGSKYGINAYKFDLVSWEFDRVEWEGNKDCYVGDPPLPNGLADVSACYWGFPMAVSFPHFLYGDNITRSYVDGLTPNIEDHGSWTLIEPITGLPLEGKAKSQMNLVLKDISGFNSNIHRFSNSVIPLAWLEYHQVGLPWHIRLLVYYTSVVVRFGQLPFSIFLITSGMACIYYLTFSLRRLRHGSEENLLENNLLKTQCESFIEEEDV